MKLGAIAAMLLPALLPVGVTGQRVDFQAMRDSLARIGDVPLLYRMQSSGPPAGAARDAAKAIERGLIALRIYELTGDRDDAERARDTFRKATDAFPDVPWTYYGLALALVHGPGVRIPSPGGVLDGVTVAQSFAEILGKDPRSRARRELHRALAVNAAFTPAAALLADLAVEDGRDEDALRDARAALLAARAAGSTSPDLGRALAAVETALGDYDAAAEAAAGSLAANATDAGALHARAVALFLQPGHADEAATLYFRGLDQLTSAAALRYHFDVEMLATPAEAAEWRVADLPARAEWLRRFWERRAAEGGVTVAERIAEHYRRLALAREKYLRNSRRGVDGSGILLAESSNGGGAFDDRGIVLIRHGEPARIVRSTARGVLPNETWVYGRGADGNLLFHFAALRGANDYSLLSDVLDALDPSVSLTTDQRVRAVMTLVEDRAPYEPGYQAAAGRLRVLLNQGEALNGTEIRAITERAEADYRRKARRALETDTDFASFDAPLTFDYDLFTFRSPSHRTDLTAAFAVPAEGLATASRAGRSVYPLRISVILLDTLQGTVTRVDTIELIPAGAAASGYVRANIALQVVASEHTIHRVVVRDTVNDAGAIYGGGTRLRDYSGTGLLVSDLVLAAPDSAGAWRRGDLRLAVTLPRQFRPEHPFTLFYEIYNLEPRAAYGTHLAVEPVDRGGIFDRIKGLFGGGPDRVDLRFNDVASPDDDGVIQEVRRLGTDLGPGRYRMTITVTDIASGASATSETLFEVTR